MQGLIEPQVSRFHGRVYVAGQPPQIPVELVLDGVRRPMLAITVPVRQLL